VLAERRVAQSIHGTVHPATLKIVKPARLVALLHDLFTNPLADHRRELAGIGQFGGLVWRIWNHLIPRYGQGWIEQPDRIVGQGGQHQ
jgi:hypothetical protein